MRDMVEEPDIVVFEAPLGSDLYRQALALREASAWSSGVAFRADPVRAIALVPK